MVLPLVSLVVLVAWGAVVVPNHPLAVLWVVLHLLLDILLLQGILLLQEILLLQGILLQEILFCEVSFQVDRPAEVGWVVVLVIVPALCWADPHDQVLRLFERPLLLRLCRQFV